MSVYHFLKIESFSEDKVFSVSEFLDFLNRTLRPCQAIVRGEVGEKISFYPQYLFFSLLDKNDSVLKCFVVQEVLEKLGLPLEPGMEINVFGYPEVRKNRGELKFQVRKIELLGEGFLKRQFEILKRKLESQGYFAKEFKKSIPRFCENIGLITSTHGKGAKRDFLTHLGNFGFRIYFYNVKVEGPSALLEITEAIRWFNENLSKTDVLVLTRGGGDWESLKPFNSEDIVKAIFASKIPIITGIGHEADFTLADYVADLRASTPTHAAKILNENWTRARVQIREFESNLQTLMKKIIKNVKEKIDFWDKEIYQKLGKAIEKKKKKINEITKNFIFSFQNAKREFQRVKNDFLKNLLFFEKKFCMEEERIFQLSEKLEKSQANWFKRVKEKIAKEEKSLRGVDPSLKLKQGYTITYDLKGQILKGPEKIKISQRVITKFFKGQIESEVKKKSYERREV